MKKDKSQLDIAIEYIKNNRERVLELERELEEIKHSKEWISNMNVMRVYEYRGIIDKAPLHSNDYRVPKKITEIE